MCGPGRSIGTGLVGDHHARRAGWLSYQLAQELLRCAPTLSALNEGVQNEAVSIDGANMALHLAVDRDHDLVEMPLVAELRRADGSCWRRSVRTSLPSTARPHS